MSYNGLYRLSIVSHKLSVLTSFHNFIVGHIFQVNSSTISTLELVISILSQKHSLGFSDNHTLTVVQRRLYFLEITAKMQLRNVYRALNWSNLQNNAMLVEKLKMHINTDLKPVLRSAALPFTLPYLLSYALRCIVIHDSMLENDVGSVRPDPTLIRGRSPTSPRNLSGMNTSP